MKKMKTFLIAGLALFTSNVATAVGLNIVNNECSNTEINYPVLISHGAVQIGQNDNLAYQVTNDKLYVKGQQVLLTDKQQNVLDTYISNLKAQVEKTIPVVQDTILINIYKLYDAFEPLFDEETKAKANELIDLIQKKLRNIANSSDDNYYLDVSTDSLRALFDDELTVQLEEISLALKDAVVDIMSDPSQIAEKMPQMQAALSLLEEAGTGKLDKEIEANAIQLCNGFKAVIEGEKQARALIPELANYPLAN